MPIVPPGVGSPFPLVGDIMNTARQRVNDMHNDVNGDLLTNDAPYAQTLLTDAWTWLQDKCTEAGVETNSDEIQLFGLPARATNDPFNQSWITWQGCSDGVNEYDSPALPQNLVGPLDVWVRQSGMTVSPVQMAQAINGLPRSIDTNLWQWRANGFYYYGAQFPQDMIISGNFYFPDLDVTQSSSPVPIRGCKECLGSRVAFYFTNARTPGSAGASSLQQMSEDAFTTGIGTRTSHRQQRKTVRRRPFSYRGLGLTAPFPYVVSS